ncbi:MAG: hypothetical protein ACK4K9_10875 [Bacteroidia bacterium]
MNQIKPITAMSPKSLIILLIASFFFISCGTSNIGFSSVDDDAFWNSRTSSGRASNSNNEITNSSNTGNRTNERPRPQGNFTPIESYYDIDRQENAYNEWNNRRNFETNGNIQHNQNNTFNEQVEERESRRLGSERTFYYNDPYFNALSPNWGWTSFYTPIFRPGFYNWAPGWNIGLGWNSFSGWNVGFGFGAMYPGWGWNRWGWNNWGFYDPWCTWCNPWSPWGYYDPFWGPGWGWNYWYWNRFYNPWYWHDYRRGNFNGGDVVQNRPLLRPRSGGESSGGGSSLPPRGRIANDLNAPAQPVQQNPANQHVRPDMQQQQMNTTRPGGDLIRDRDGNPTYIPPARGNRPTDFNNNTPADMQRSNEQQMRDQPQIRYNAPEFNQNNNPNQQQPIRERNNNFERVQPQIQREPMQSRPAPTQPQGGFDRGSPRGGGFSNPGNSGGRGSAPQSRPR